jgi:hypothetical protein
MSLLVTSSESHSGDCCAQDHLRTVNPRETAYNPLVNYFECKSRLRDLKVFRLLGAKYFSNITTNPDAWMGDSGPSENADAQNARQELNIMMMRVGESFLILGIPKMATYYPPPAFGGYVHRVDLVGNMFELWRYQIRPQQVEDALLRAIGQYEQEERRLFRQLFNPFYWLNQILGIPFRFLTAVGLNGQKAEESILGKLAKATVGAVTVVAGILSIYDHPRFIARISQIVYALLHWRSIH